MITPRIVSAALCVLLALPAAAIAKRGHEPIGERDVTVSSMSRGAEPGDPWSALFTVLGHDGRPVSGVNPVVTLTDMHGGRYFAVGLPTGKPGSYRARLPAPAAGLYRVVVDDGGVEHAVGVTRVAGPSRAPAGGAPGNAGRAIPVGAAAVAGCLLLLAAVRRRRGDGPSASAA